MIYPIEDDLLTQKEVLKKLNKYSSHKITKQAFYARVKRGVIKYHKKITSPKKFYRFDEVARAYEINFREIEQTPQKIKEDNKLYTPTNIYELNNFLKEANTPKMKVDVINSYWNGKIKEAKYKEIMSGLIPIDEATEVLEIANTFLKDKMYKIPKELKAKCPNLSEEMMMSIKIMIDKAFYELSKHKIQ